MNKDRFIRTARIITIAGFTVISLSVPAVTAAALDQGTEIKNALNKVGGEEDDVELDGAIVSIFDAFLFVIGAFAVIIMIYGGFRYVTSRGDAQEIVAAKNIILYAVVGVVVAMVAFAVANFVTSNL